MAAVSSHLNPVQYEGSRSLRNVETYIALHVEEAEDS